MSAVPAPSLLSAAELQSTVARLAAEIGRDHPDGVVLVGVLDGALMLMADLLRAMTVPVEVDFLAISRFAPDSGRVRLLKDLDLVIEGRTVVLVDVIADTGLTADFLVRQLRLRDPHQIELCLLFDRRRRRLLPIELRYVGHEIGDEFLLGYGLGYQGLYQTLDHVLACDIRSLRSDPRAHVATLLPQAPLGLRGRDHVADPASDLAARPEELGARVGVSKPGVAP